jgi:hypothetical protein
MYHRIARGHAQTPPRNPPDPDRDRNLALAVVCDLHDLTARSAGLLVWASRSVCVTGRLDRPGPAPMRRHHRIQGGLDRILCTVCGCARAPLLLYRTVHLGPLRDIHNPRQERRDRCMAQCLRRGCSSRGYRTASHLLLGLATVALSKNVQAGENE